MLTDNFSGYKALYAQGSIVEAGCWAHVRRKFFEAHKLAGSAIAQEALERIKALYAIEQTLREHPPDGRTALRQRQSQPLLEALHAWLIGQRSLLAKADATARAIDYALGRWRALCVFATDGRVPIGRVEMWRGGGRSRHRCFRPFRLAVPYEPDHGSVSTSPSSNRTCATNASGSLPTHQAFAFERSRADGIRRISPNFS